MVTGRLIAGGGDGVLAKGARLSLIAGGVLSLVAGQRMLTTSPESW